MLDYLLVVYSTYMGGKKIGQILLSFTILCFSYFSVLASEPSFEFYPTGGIIQDVEEGFTVDVLIDSGGYDITKARMVVKFNPKIVQLESAMKNNSLFEQWPTAESSTDNTNGIVMLTGYTPKDGDLAMYKTEGSPDVFARLRFEIISTKSNDLTLSFEFTGEDEELKSVIMKDATTPVNVMSTKPASVTFSLNSEEIPETAIDMNTVGIVVGAILMLVGAFVRGGRTNFFEKKRGTIVLED